jgi:hypothetical protein
LCLCGDTFYSCGLPPVRFLFIIIGTPLPGRAFTFVGCVPICRLIVAGSGMPGVGVAPGLTPFLILAASGIPGVGVPFGEGAAVAGALGVGVVEGGTREGTGVTFA